MPLSHGPGQAQGDFGEAVAVISGVECKVHYFVLDLPHSDGCFVKADPAETTEAGALHLYDNLGAVIDAILEADRPTQDAAQLDRLKEAGLNVKEPEQTKDR